jgi:hypothetical protein
VCDDISRLVTGACLGRLQGVIVADGIASITLRSVSTRRGGVAAYGDASRGAKMGHSGAGVVSRPALLFSLTQLLTNVTVDDAVGEPAPSIGGRCRFKCRMTIMSDALRSRASDIMIISTQPFCLPLMIFLECPIGRLLTKSNTLEYVGRVRAVSCHSLLTVEGVLHGGSGQHSKQC